MDTLTCRFLSTPATLLGVTTGYPGLPNPCCPQYPILSDRLNSSEIPVEAGGLERKARDDGGTRRITRGRHKEPSNMTMFLFDHLFVYSSIVRTVMDRRAAHARECISGHSTHRIERGAIVFVKPSSKYYIV